MISFTQLYYAQRDAESSTESEGVVEALCAGCEEAFSADDLSDQCGCSDDGSGCYVVDLPDIMCESCHQAYHEGPEPY